MPDQLQETYEGAEVLREEDAVDPRVSPTLRATDEELEEGLGRQLSDLILHRTRSARPQPQSDSDLEKQSQSFSTDSNEKQKVIYVCRRIMLSNGRTLTSTVSKR
jgi:hypothetical protein